MSAGRSIQIWTTVRLGFAGFTAAIVVIGFILVAASGDPGLGVLGLLLPALIPTVIFAIGIRSPAPVVAFGAILLGFTGWAWYAALFIGEQAGVAVLVVIPLTLVTSTVGSAVDYLLRHLLQSG